MFSAKFFTVFLRLILIKFKKINLFLLFNMSTLTNTKYQQDTDTLTVTESYCSLIVWNDEVNTFEWVIETLIDVCGHSTEQAEQCAIIIDSKGKYAVKEGSYDILKPQCDAITERGINATVDVMAN
jgi:ATP-dependent Clp protease adaptor protein ClpS